MTTYCLQLEEKDQEHKEKVQKAEADFLMSLQQMKEERSQHRRTNPEREKHFQELFRQQNEEYNRKVNSLVSVRSQLLSFFHSIMACHVCRLQTQEIEQLRVTLCSEGASC